MNNEKKKDIKFCLMAIAIISFFVCVGFFGAWVIDVLWGI